MLSCEYMSTSTLGRDVRSKHKYTHSHTQKHMKIKFQQTIALILCHVTLLVQSGKLLLIHIPKVLFGLPTAKFKLHKATTTIELSLNFTRIFLHGTEKKTPEIWMSWNSLDTNDIFLPFLRFSCKIFSVEKLLTDTKDTLELFHDMSFFHIKNSLKKARWTCSIDDWEDPHYKASNICSKYSSHSKFSSKCRWIMLDVQSLIFFSFNHSWMYATWNSWYPLYSDEFEMAHTDKILMISTLWISQPLFICNIFPKVT